MDRFFKAAVCDLDKLLDDFELNSDEHDCRSVSLTPPAFPFSSLGSQGCSSEVSSMAPSLPDLNSLHYGSAPSCPDRRDLTDAEVKGQQQPPLTGVDLLSSVDRRPAKTSSSAPPGLPDHRAPKPVCDLVNDTGGATSSSSHDAFGELDAAERQMEEDGVLLVDFDGPVEESRDAEGSRGELLGLHPHHHGPVGGYSASLSLLDVILPAEVGCEAEDGALSQRTTKSAIAEEEARMNRQLNTSSDLREQAGALPAGQEETPAVSNEEEDKSQEPSDSRAEAESPEGLDASESEPGGSARPPPTAAASIVSACGAPVTPTRSNEEPGAEEEDGQAGASESTEADSALEAAEGRRHDGGAFNVNARDDNMSGASSSVDNSAPAGRPPAYRGVPELCLSRRTAEEQPPGSSVAPSPEPSRQPEPSPVDPPEFGFEYLPESDQAEMLVTDEELDAFLRAHAEAEQTEGASYCSRSGDWGQDEGFSELNGDLEDRLADEELRSCRREGPEGLASPPQGDRTVCVSVEGGLLNPAPPSLPQEPPGSSRPELELSPNATFTSSSPPQSQPAGSYGGARPKQLRSPPAAGAGEEAEEEEEEARMPCASSSSEGPGDPAAEDEECGSPSPPSPNPAEQTSGGEPAPAYFPPDHGESSVGYDELSEPPPYPGEPTREGARPERGEEEAEEEEGLGSKQPDWVPDAAAPNCMNCWQKFTFTKRRHHCRACGKVYCAVCCSRKCKLRYLEKEARVCLICYNTIHRAQAREHMMSPTGPSPNPNVPSEYCSTIPPLQQARAAGTLNSPPPTVMVPVSVLKQPSNDGCPREQKRVWFADGILPNGEVADTTKLAVSGRRSSQESSPVTPDPPTPGPGGSEGGLGGGTSAPEAPRAVEVVRPPVSGPWDYALLCGVGASVQRCPSLLPEDEEGLPPLLIVTGDDEAGGDVLVEERPAPCQILLLLEEGGPRPLTFVLNANLLVNVKLVTYCSQRCWCFGSSGLQAVGQRELVFILECLPDERSLPKDLFMLYLNIYKDAQKGKYVEALGNVTFTSSFLGSKEHGGMLFFTPTCQPLEGLTLPPPPFLCGLLVQRLEVPWAKVFPLRLLLRLGAEHSVYPTTLVSVRFRDSVYRETGHTIMNLLADLRNFQYSLPAVAGLRIHMEMGHSYIDIPKSRFSEMLKVVNASNEHVISVGATLSSEADSHLVCFQNEDGNYQTQANSKPGKTRTVTGASFVVFNGALKASSGFIAKSSIVEDGLMVQIPPETMESLRAALRGQTDFHIPCGKNDGGELRENVSVRWVDWSAPTNTGVSSAVDSTSLDGVHSVRRQQDTTFESDGHNITCTEVFYQLKAEGSLAAVLPSCSVFQREMALATCSALTPHLAVLLSSGINSLSLRVSTQTDMVEYQAGSGGRLLPQRYMNELDGALIPVIHGGSAGVPQIAMDMEFIFYITHTI